MGIEWNSIDWNQGHYESAATDLAPVAETVVERAAISPGNRVVDIGCGTGNATLAAARRGAQVTGVDPAVRLLEVARARAEESGVDATFIEGEAGAVPLASGVADVVLSVLGVIFAPDPVAAAAELTRLTSPDGRILLASWIPVGPMTDVVTLFRKAIADRKGLSSGAPPFAWHEPDALTGLFSPHGFSVTVETQRLAYTAGSAREFVEFHFLDHPLAAAGWAQLKATGDRDALTAEAVAIFAAANQDSNAFRITSPYVVATATR